MPEPFVPIKPDLIGPSFRAIELWQLDHESATPFVSNSNVFNSTGKVRGQRIYDTNDGLFYYWDGVAWRLESGQILDNNVGGVALAEAAAIGSSSADASHDAGINIVFVMPNLAARQRVLIDLYAPALQYAVDPSVTALMTLSIFRGATELAGSHAVFVTGVPDRKTTAVKVQAIITNSDIAAGPSDCKAVIASSNLSQAYHFYAESTKRARLFAMVI